MTVMLMWKQRSTTEAVIPNRTTEQSAPPYKKNTVVLKVESWNFFHHLWASMNKHCYGAAKRKSEHPYSLSLGEIFWWKIPDFSGFFARPHISYVARKMAVRRYCDNPLLHKARPLGNSGYTVFTVYDCLEQSPCMRIPWRRPIISMRMTSQRN